MRTAAVSRSRDDDRLSELPDCLLEIVLSCLTTRQAARTSVLSRRRHVWRDVPCVDIDQREFLTATPTIDGAGSIYAARDPRLWLEESTIRRHPAPEQRDRRFEDVVDTLLPLHDAPPPPLDTFRLRFACEDLRSAGRWIRRGLARRPAAFHLSSENDHDDDAPLAYRREKWPLLPRLPDLIQHRDAAGAGAFTCRLTTLCLTGLTLSTNFADGLSADFPVLETLQLRNCWYDFDRLASGSLRNLRMANCMSTKSRWRDKLVLVAPAIASLCIHGYSSPWVTSEECETTSLVAASLTNPAGTYGHLSSLRYARSLAVSSIPAMESLGGFPVFPNLRTLRLHECDVGAGQVLRLFLQKAPGLETLKLINCELSSDLSRSRKRKAMSWEPTTAAASDGGRAHMALQCKKLKSIEVDFLEGLPVRWLALILADISKEVVQPIQTCVRDGMCKVKISFR